ncbi:acyl-CoA thioesterase [Methanohalophilus levihalophilus]|uniref:PaaI family thioesterase n=1 Tax=Methanohalophilus levihalophilus TaxID=1431282 RepID=UPI001AE919EF|nr:PaaI family thioesterase [Methanohalophilus levihalophilus]MBP2030654.1 acyl-CoA thioesterase [Methanohalophilus levihalophilus]
MEDLKKFFERDKFAALCGIELLEVSEGYAKASMKITENHYNGVRTVQGGAIFTLADLTFAAASNSHGTVAVAINVNISFTKAALEGTLYAEAKETTRNPKISTYTITVTDDSGDIISIFEGMAYRKKQKLEEFAD